MNHPPVFLPITYKWYKWVHFCYVFWMLVQSFSLVSFHLFHSCEFSQYSRILLKNSACGYMLCLFVWLYALFVCVVIVLVNETAAARGGALSGNSLTAVIGKSTYLYLSIFATYNHMLLNLSKYAIWRSLKIFPMWEGERRRTNHIEKRLTIFRHAHGAVKRFAPL